MADMIPVVSGMYAVDDDKQELSARFEVIDQLGELLQGDVKRLKDCANSIDNDLERVTTLKTYLECMNLVTKTTKELMQIKKQSKGQGSGIEEILEGLGIL